MQYNKPYLKDFIHYCKFENALETKRASSKCKINFDICMQNLKEKMMNDTIKNRYEKNIEAIKQMLNNTSYFHNTSVDCIISILDKGNILSINQMEKMNVSFNYKISIRGINEKLLKYVFVYPKGEWIYGLCEIEFKKEIEKIANSYFLPKSCLCIQEHEFNNNIMYLYNWKSYLQDHIAIFLEEPLKYFDITPPYNRPEFLFTDNLSIEYIKIINCKGKSTYESLCNKIKEKFGNDSPYLNIIRYIN